MVSSWDKESKSIKFGGVNFLFIFYEQLFDGSWKSAKLFFYQEIKYLFDSLPFIRNSHSMCKPSVTRTCHLSSIQFHRFHTLNFFWDQNTTGHISSHSAQNYEGIRNTPLTNFALLCSVSLIIGTEIKDAAKNYTKCYYFSSENGHNRLKSPPNFCFQLLLNIIVRFT